MLSLSHIFTIVSDMYIRGGWQGRGPLGWCHCWQSWSVTWCQMSSPSSDHILQWTRMMSCSPGNHSYWSLGNFTGYIKTIHFYTEIWIIFRDVLTVKTSQLAGAFARQHEARMRPQTRRNKNKTKLSRRLIKQFVPSFNQEYQLW